jgi:hypothetical protein
VCELVFEGGSGRSTSFIEGLSCDRMDSDNCDVIIKVLSNVLSRLIDVNKVRLLGAPIG